VSFFRHLPALLAVIAVTLGSSGVGRAAAVVCIGSDHLAIEPTGSDHCHEHAGEGSALVGANESDCIDVAVVPVDLYSPSPVHALALPAPAAPLCFTGGFAPPRPATTLDVAAPRPPPWLGVVSGIVLRV